MKKIRNLFYSFIVMVLLALGLVFVDDCSVSRDGYLIGVSQCSGSDWARQLSGELRMMSYIDDSLDICIKSADGDSKRQARQIDSLLNMGIDLLVVSPNQMNVALPAIERAYDRGVPVVVYDRKVNTSKYTAYIGSDNYRMGYNLGLYVAAQLNGKGNVVEICGLQNSSSAAGRRKGFADALKEYPGVKIVDTDYGDWTTDGARKAMTRILVRNKDIDYVFAHNDGMAYGAYLAAKENGVKRMPKFVGIDGLRGKHGGVQLVRNGILEASYLNPTGGDDVIKLALKILKGEKYCKENTIATSIITKDNAELTYMAMADADKRRAILDNLHSQINKYENYTHKQNIFMWMLAIFLVFMVLASFLLYKAYLAKNKLSVLLTKKNKDLKRLNDEVIELTQSRLAFFTNVSHELRTPLTLIVDPVKQIVENAKLDRRSAMLMSIVERNALALQRLVDEIMDFRKIQNGKMTLKLASFDLLENFKVWVANFYPLAENKGVSLEVDTDGFTHRSVMADEEKVSRIVFNLMSNAIKYTDEGGKIVVTLSNKPGGKFQLSVKNTGEGISEEDQEKVFDSFFQAKNAVGGTGIGLAVVKEFAKLHNGTVAVESRIGEGATFYVEMPCSQETFERNGIIVDGDADAALPQVTDTEQAERNGMVSKMIDEDEKPTLLIVDDNKDIREYISNVLGKEYLVLEASDGKEALEVALRTVPDIVVCDVMMPVMDGIEFCTRLRQSTAISHIPVILLTAKNMEEHKIDGYEHGADSYITKPFSSKLLRARIENILESRRLLNSKAKAAGDFGGFSPKALDSVDKDFVTRLREIILKNLDDPDFGVESIGKEIGLSRVQLYRKVKALTGASVVDLLRKARLQRGRTLLEKTGKSVSEIAYEVGFSSPSYFTKCFKEEYGVLPGEVRTK